MNIKNLLNKENAQQQQPTEQRQSLKALTTKAIPESFLNDIFEEPRATQCRIDNGLPPDYIHGYFNFAFFCTKETKLIMFQYKILHDIGFTE